MSNNFPVRGLKELDAFLAAFPERMQKAAYRAALTAAAAPIRDDARLRARNQSGKMAKAIKTGSARQNQDGTFQVSVRLDPKMPHGFLGVFHEYGVAPHFITRGDADVTVRTLNKRAKRAGGAEKRDNGLVKIPGHELTRRVQTRDGEEQRVIVINKQFIGGAVFHPGHAAHPFMRPALEAKRDEVVAAFAAKIRAWMENKSGFVAPEPEDD